MSGSRPRKCTFVSATSSGRTTRCRRDIYDTTCLGCYTHCQCQGTEVGRPPRTLYHGRALSEGVTYMTSGIKEPARLQPTQMCLYARERAIKAEEYGNLEYETCPTGEGAQVTAGPTVLKAVLGHRPHTPERSTAQRPAH